MFVKCLNLLGKASAGGNFRGWAAVSHKLPKEQQENSRNHKAFGLWGNWKRTTWQKSSFQESKHVSLLQTSCAYIFRIASAGPADCSLGFFLVLQRRRHNCLHVGFLSVFLRVNCCVFVRHETRNDSASQLEPQTARVTPAVPTSNSRAERKPQVFPWNPQVNRRREAQ